MSGYVESYRGQVLASECDLLGHMNIQFYISRLSHAIWNMCYLVGISPEEIKGGKRGLATVQQDSQYLAEVMAGDILHMETAILKASEKTITFHHKLINSETGKTALTNTSVVVYMDLDARKATPLTPLMKDKVNDFMIESEDVA